jgi:hypothetical protein
MPASTTVERGSFRPPVRLVVEYRRLPSESMWGEIVRPGLARVLSISHYSTLSYGDVVKVEPICSCGERHEHYAVGQRVFRGSRRVQAFTRARSRRRLREVAEYLAGWPTTAGYEVAEQIAPGYVGSQIMPDGFPAGLAAYGVFDDEHRDTHWRIAFPWPTARRKAAAFLDRCPHLAWHELRRDEEER